MIHLLYLACASALIVGLKRLGHPKTARSGNLVASGGMLGAVVITLIDTGILNWGLVIAGLAIGAVIGAVTARRIEMTAMPQLVSLLNGLGGLASALVAAEVVVSSGLVGITADNRVNIVLSTLVGAVTFTGSVIAFAKLQGIMPGRPILFAGQRALNAVIALAMFAFGVWMVAAESTFAYWATGALGLILGVTAVIPIGGADMPVVISLLNSLSGLAAAAAGFVVGNNALIIGGALVGSAGLILTFQMTEAMNRTLGNVLFSGFGAVAAGASSTEQKSVNTADATDVAIALAYAERVMIIPGYGLAVAQAQYAVRDLARALEERGVTVYYAIHPVAGRMPGHMNVLLAEADVPYEKLLDLEQADPQLPQTDAVLVLGANDVVNPSARDDPSSPIYGMPILNADHARRVIVVKRSLSPGFAGIDNPLFYKENTLMYFADVKQALEEILAALGEV
jgi:NAD(P) transhydrogenase subunit beta